jgi:LysM repeat protein
LEKVALLHNTTPSALLKLNKLGVRTVFPGQVLIVPETAEPTEGKENDGPLAGHETLSLSPGHATFSNQDVIMPVWSLSRQTSTARPGHAQRLSAQSSNDEERTKPTARNTSQGDASARSSLSSRSNQSLDADEQSRFIKIHLKLITKDRVSLDLSYDQTANCLCAEHLFSIEACQKKMKNII